MDKRCMLCGRLFVVEEAAPDPYDDEEDIPKKSVSVCLLCQAKLRHEADESQKSPKPM
ncbi:MAG: hypothetical protein XE00_0335 [Desulfofundulus kuznetsovii]|nr:MAG: hypothetical protein XD84_1251 [Desulfotomaculum sp. 46_80]KUK85150.1 MAG: hypothetical protein XE00_0335 [Desulfofundulus kuznetsovii]